jgi:uncharacterized protein (DUF1778 family)
MDTIRKRKSARREVRLSERDNNLLIEAAGISGMSVSEFVVEHAVSDAEEIVRSYHTIELAPDAYRSFIDALDNVRPNPAFADAVRRARSLKHLD